MRLPGIRGQLTAWYSLILALSIAAFGTVAYLAMQYSIRQTVQSSLSERTEGVRNIIQQDGPKGRAALEDELSEFADGLGRGGRIRVADAGGLIFASTGMGQPMEPRRRFGGRRLGRIWLNGERFLMLRQNIDAAGTTYDVTMAIATGDFDRTLTNGGVLLFATAPLFLALAALGGYWMSRRALKPVDEMTHAARTIGAQNLARRLAVPPARDELGRLAETLNEMLGRLEAAFQKITQFTADASHELRTPLAVMRTSAELALRKPRSEEEYQETLVQILREADSVSQLIENLLAIARADSGSAQLPMERTNLGAILNDVCEKSRLLANQKGVTLSRNGGSAPVWVQANRESLERLLLILLDNALKYTPGGGRVDVKLTSRDGIAVTEIQDTGIGIPEEDMPHIFDRFYRADRARTREPGGAGLGLAIGQWIAQAHGGEIRVQSETGKGSSFEVELPLAEN